jgi:hypothetical protein
MNRLPTMVAALALITTPALSAAAQTASPSNRDTTVQTGGPQGSSGAVGPNDRPSGADSDGTTSTTPPAAATHASHHGRHAHDTKPATAAPAPGQR